MASSRWARFIRRLAAWISSRCGGASSSSGGSGARGTVKVGYLRETPIMVMTKEGVTHDTVPWFMERFGEAYVAQLQNFIEHLQKQKEPSIKCADGVAARRRIADGVIAAGKYQL